MQTSAESPAPVRQVAMAVAGWVDRLGVIWVEGQVAQLNRRSASATVFLTLRDSAADISVSVTARRSLIDRLDPPLVEGASVVVQAKPTYYAPRGSFSLQARDLRMVGLGELLARLERRRQLLAAEGLFATERKRPLPFLPQGLGLVTASGSAAERDVVEHARRRWPGLRIRAAYAAMQGHRCVAEVMEALAQLDRDPEIDVIVVARGGGSIEDLLPFSDEGLVRAVSACRTPVVSAIGHEPDVPLLDLVADLRASTPTDAAKTVVPDVAERARRRGPAARPRPSYGARPARARGACTGLAAQPPGARRPPARPRRAAARRRPSCATGRGGRCATGSTAPTPTWPTVSPGCARSPRSRPCSAGTPSCRPPTGDVVTDPADVDRGQHAWTSGSRRAASAPP